MNSENDLNVAIQIIGGEHEIQNALISILDRIIMIKAIHEVELGINHQISNNDIVSELKVLDGKIKHLILSATLLGYPKMLDSIFSRYQVYKYISEEF